MSGVKSLEDHLAEIEVRRPSDLILEQIRALIRSGVLHPGQRLPSERALSERFGIGRGHVREALRKLEFYGIVKTRPQSGTVVESLGASALDGLISNVLGIEGGTDYKTLYEVRDPLEIEAARLAAARATETLVTDLEAVTTAHRKAVQAGTSGMGEDVLFHLKIAEASGNALLRTLISLMAPDIIKLSDGSDTCREGRGEEAIEEHRRILAAIKAGDGNAAAAAMDEHITRSRQQHELIVGADSREGRTA
jgi:GntR family transcriptional repressor for pyruvate dehydrogenase complex